MVDYGYRVDDYVDEYEDLEGSKVPGHLVRVIRSTTRWVQKGEGLGSLSGENQIKLLF